MKKERAGNIQEVEKKYGLDNCEKTEFVKYLIKGVTKIEKKMSKIENYETMKKEGKNLNKEMVELIEKKQSFIDHLKILKEVVDAYVKYKEKPTEVIDPEKIRQDTKTEVKRQILETHKQKLKNLSQFFIIALMLKEKDHISPTPLTKVPAQKQEEIMSSFNNVVTLSRNKETNMLQEVEKLIGIFNNLMEKDTYISNIMDNTEVSKSEFKINEGPEQEFVILQPADKLEMSEKAIEEPVQHAVKKQNEKQNTGVLAEKEEIKEEKKKEIKEEVKKEEEKTVLETGLQQNKEEQQEQQEEGQEEEQDEEEEFEVAMSKSQKRELNATRGGRGQRGERRGGFRQRNSKEGYDGDERPKKSPSRGEKK